MSDFRNSLQPQQRRPAFWVRLAAAIALCCGAAAAVAAPLIVNGGFEAAFAGWTRADQVGSDGSFFVQSGATSPLNGDPVPAPPQGANAAMTDSFGPGSHVLYQDFIAVIGPATLRFDLFIGNRANRFATPDSLRFDLTGVQTDNQQARVDILSAGADPFSVAAADILLTLYDTDIGDPLVSGYTTISTDITALLAAHAGQTLRLRFAEVDNLAQFQLGVDNVGFATPTATVSEPASLALVGAALAAWLGVSRRRASRALAAAGVALLPLAAQADSIPAQMLDPTLRVEAIVTAGLAQPIGIVFLAPNDFLVLEKASGQVKRFINGALQPQPVLDLSVNSSSERGLLSLVLHPNFPAVPHVFIRWTESSTGADSNAVADVALLGNRVDRFLWTGASLVLDTNLVRLRARQTDNIPVPGHPGSNNGNEAGNHNGGVMRFGPDGKLYVFTGDLGRRGWMQNLSNGPYTTVPLVDDTFGGPQPDNAHLAGVILRLNTDGSAPADNPFFAAGASIGGEVGVNLQKVFSYGHRNGFGMAFDPQSGALWETENADDAYAELNRVVPGLNGGWIQFAGPVGRIKDWKFIEINEFGRVLQQVRYPPTRAAYTPAAALAKLFMLPGAVYKDPELSWRYEVGPSGATFVQGTALGAVHTGTLWFGSARSFQQVGGTGGSLFRISLTADRLNVDTSADPRLADKVADNLFRATKFDATESETLLIGRGFGITASIEQGPDGNLYVVSLSDGTIYRISRAF